ncbi:hypothetical protein N9Z78_01415 [Akkermansiaceae bacterium]|nr:hypothetical protein [Akkermansiaceae bacterium]
MIPFLFFVFFAQEATSCPQSGGVLDTKIDTILRRNGVPDYAFVGKKTKTLKLAVMRDFRVFAKSKSKISDNSFLKPGTYDWWLDLFLVDAVLVGEIESGAQFPCFYRSMTKKNPQTQTDEIDRIVFNQNALTKGELVVVFVYAGEGGRRFSC